MLFCFNKNQVLNSFQAILITDYILNLNYWENNAVSFTKFTPLSDIVFTEADTSTFNLFNLLNRLSHCQDFCLVVRSNIAIKHLMYMQFRLDSWYRKFLPGQTMGNTIHDSLCVIPSLINYG